MKAPKNIVLWFVGLLILGVALAYIVWRLMDMKESGWLVLLIALPNAIFFMIYFISSGVINELGYGDYKLVFGKAASEPVSGDFGSIAPSLDDMIQVGDQGVGLLEEMLAQYSLSEEKPILMVIRLGEKYPREVTLGFIEKLSRYTSFKFVGFVNQANKFIAYTPAWAIRQRLSNPIRGDEFLEVVQNQSRRNELFNYPNVLRETVKPNSTRIDALQVMDRLNLSTIPVVDSNGELNGIIERDKVISQMLIKMVEKSTV